MGTECSAPVTAKIPLDSEGSLPYKFMKRYSDVSLKETTRSSVPERGIEDFFRFRTLKSFSDDDVQRPGRCPRAHGRFFLLKRRKVNRCYEGYLQDPW